MRQSRDKSEQQNQAGRRLSSKSKENVQDDIANVGRIF